MFFLKDVLWRNNFWSPSYFAGPFGGAPLSVIRQTSSNSNCLRLKVAQFISVVNDRVFLRPGINKVWDVKEAKTHFSELVTELQQSGGYHTITQNGHPVAVILSYKEFEKIQMPGSSLLDFFRNAPFPEVELATERRMDLE